MARHETDVGGQEDETINRNLFRDAVFERLTKGLPAADSPPAAEWESPREAHGEPTTQITLKSAKDLGGASGQLLSQVVFPLVVLGAAIAGGTYYYLNSASEA